jgi:dTDP-4-dehydrorhamnose reductase
VILIFGAGGQLGRELIDLAAADGTPLAGLSHAQADITDADSIGRAVRDSRPTLVVNAAAYNAVDRAESEPQAAVKANAVGPAMLAQACAAVRVPLIHISTDYVFDGKKSGAYRETDPVNPLGVYARSKSEGEKAVRRLWPHHLILRTAWLYGVHGANFLKTMVRLASERDELNVVADQTGSPTATFDLASGILAAALAIQRGGGQWGTYHLAGTGAATRHAFAERIVSAQRRFSGRAPRVNAVSSSDFPAAARRPKNSALDSSKFAAAFGFRARDWREGVDATVAALFEAKAPA